MQLSALITLALITAAAAETTLYRRVDKKNEHVVAILNPADWYITTVGGAQHCSSVSAGHPNKGLSLTADPHRTEIGVGSKLEVKHTTDTVLKSHGFNVVHDGVPFADHWTLETKTAMDCHELMNKINAVPWQGPVKRKNLKRSEHPMNRVRMVNEAIEFEKRQMAIEELD